MNKQSFSLNKFVLYIYIIFLLIFVLYSYLFIDPNLFYLKPIFTGIAFSQRYLVTAVYVCFLSVFFAFYIYFLKNALSKKLDKNTLKKIILISSLLIFSYPAIISYDIFNYMATAKVTFGYKENPYLVMPIEFKNDPMLLYTRAANKFALYGPIWVLLTGVPFILGLGNFYLSLFLFKILSAVFYFLLILLIFKISNKNIYSTAFFALNPLVLIETFVSGHNDSVMMFFALASIYLLKRNKKYIALLLLVLSILIKFATLFLFPIFLFVLYGRLRNKEINWEKIYSWSGVSMFIIFLLSPLREEMYPWYAIWFIPFAALLPKRKIINGVAIVLSFGLMLRYTPFMAIGTYFGPTPIIRILVTLTPVVLYLLFVYLKKMKWV